MSIVANALPGICETLLPIFPMGFALYRFLLPFGLFAISISLPIALFPISNSLFQVSRSSLPFIFHFRISTVPLL